MNYIIIRVTKFCCKIVNCNYAIVCVRFMLNSCTLPSNIYCNLFNLLLILVHTVYYNTICYCFPDGLSLHKYILFYV